VKRILFLLVLLIGLFPAVVSAQETCSLPTRLYAGGHAYVTPGTANNLRAQPNRTAAVIGQIPGSGNFVVISDPVCSGGIYWLQTEYNGISGWTAEGVDGEYFVEPTSRYVFTGYEPEFDHISFDFDTFWASFAAPYTVPGDAIAPEHVEIALLSQYTPSDQIPAGSPLVAVYPTALFAEYPAYQQADDTLRQALYSQSGSVTDMLVVPFLGREVSGQSEVEYITFATGLGIRMVANVGGSPVFTFQGITIDGAYYIAATFPAGGDYRLYDHLLRSLDIQTQPAFVTGKSGGVVDYQGVSFQYDASLAAWVEVLEVEQFIDEMGESMYGSMPAYTEFQFRGFPVDGIQPPRVQVFPISTFEPGSIAANGLSALQAFLNGNATLTPHINFDGGQVIPVIPPINAMQVFVAQPQYLDFDGGHGVRFISYYSQSVNPIANSDMFYIYVGVTDDQTFAVAAYFPLHTAVLPDDYPDMNNFDYEAFSANYQTYMNETFNALQAATDYAPTLTLLDQLIASLSFGAG